MSKWIYFFEEGRSKDKHLLGGKGANLAEMSHLGLPVPAGFTITTQSCIHYLEEPDFFTSHLQEEILKAVSELELKTGRSFMNKEGLPLLVSVRSGAEVSMPGMMDTILNLGLNDERVKDLAELTNRHFAYDCYRRLLQMFADVVYGLAKERFDEQLDQAQKENGKPVQDFSQLEQEALVESYKKVYQSCRKSFPQDPADQLFAAVKAVFASWNNPRAKIYRQLNAISDKLGTAVNVQMMVFGNSDEESGTGVVFTRNPAKGQKELFGEFLLNAQGEDVVAGIRTPEPIQALAQHLPKAYQDFKDYAQILERHYRDMQDIEFTIERGQLFILQTREGKRTAQAALQIALDLVEEGLISQEEALLRINPKLVDQLIHPVFEPESLESAQPIAQGLPASPGAAWGKLVFTAQDAKRYHEEGQKVILVRQETSPEDIEGMIVSQAIVTSHGGMTSHAAVVARGMGTCCVAGCSDLSIKEEEKIVHYGKKSLKEGDIISVDGSSGKIYLGALPTSLIEKNENLEQVLLWADQHAQLEVRANAETIPDLRTAIKFSAKGIGLARTEHMFFGKARILEMRRLILADQEADRKEALVKLLTFQAEDFYQMFKEVGDRPLVIRLLDPPLHEFLPKEDVEIEEVAQELGKSPSLIRERIKQLVETNPMLGHRGCRLGISQPAIYQMQVEAVISSAIRLQQKGLAIKPEIMIPLIAEKKELDYLRALLEDHISHIFKKYSAQAFPYEIGTMIELPRACLIADQLAQAADFFSFGTNDLTQMTYGFSRDDIGKFINHYKNKEIISFDPFQTLDKEGVGELMRLAVEKARRIKPQLAIGVCGEVGGDPASISFLEEIGVDYVSCSPYRIPAARLAVAQASLLKKLEQERHQA
ncbi:pyruvate, phosphate dikinase [Streptococcus oricebi]|uniref:Pyruvate, phosphate dikinase n=1 Tax=Streptococcus oricebi TaxID=1547447 RepID=A0ABS5B575_9STRE|nr:pyruvate, phosphate dikinase [Streptococcus oricebi]MBP2623134.1 pyruvate, phosphate dikinase [Streptococcus oricebi]